MENRGLGLSPQRASRRNHDANPWLFPGSVGGLHGVFWDKTSKSIGENTKPRCTIITFTQMQPRDPGTLARWPIQSK